MKRNIFCLMLVLCIAVAGYAVYAYFVLPPGTTVGPSTKTLYDAHHVRILTHVFFAVVALVTGPFQFMPSIRRHRSIHRKIGYVYFTALAVGSSAGLGMAFIAAGGLVSTLGFGSLALLTLFSGFKALACIRRRDFAAHEAWAIRSFALIFAAVTLRLYLPLFFIMGFKFDSFYPAVSWLCWVPNLVFTEWILLPSLRAPVNQHPQLAKL